MKRSLASHANSLPDLSPCSNILCDNRSFRVAVVLSTEIYFCSVSMAAYVPASLVIT